MSILLVEQNVALAAETSERAYVMSLGRVVHEIKRGEWRGFRERRAAAARLSGRRARPMRTDVSGWVTRLTDEDIVRYTRSGCMAQRHAGRLRATRQAERAPDRVAVIEGDRSHHLWPASWREARQLAGAFTRMRTAARRRHQLPAAQLDRDDGDQRRGVPGWPGGQSDRADLPRGRSALHPARLRGRACSSSRSMFRNFDYPAMAQRLRPELPDAARSGRRARSSPGLRAATTTLLDLRSAPSARSDSARTPTRSSWCSTPRARPATPRAFCTATTRSCRRSTR